MAGKRNNCFIIMLVLSIFMYSCWDNKAEKKVETTLSKKEDCPVIFYELPENAMKQINEEMKDRDVVYAFISILEDPDYFNEITNLRFTYSQKSDRINNIAKKSNRKMVLNEKEIPILFSSDILYSNEPEDTLHQIQDFNFATFKFDKKGNIIEKIKF
ncbi:MAG: hypothetical protein KF900_11785 [Bacteroidetes bacterium]|nr:hypothetical protein [Bacteroidota bacterium]